MIDLLATLAVYKHEKCLKYNTIFPIKNQEIMYSGIQDGESRLGQKLNVLNSA